jgi:hypothetical protein
MKFLKCLILFLLIHNNILSVDFDDLKEKQGKIYGSEKDEKYIYDAFVSEWENWPRINPTHNSFHFFWIFNSTEYPKYSKSEFFPFYSIQNSKVDSRYQSNYFLLYNYEKEKNGNESSYFFPFYFHRNTNSENTTLFPFLFTYFTDLKQGTRTENSKLLFLFYSNELKDSNSSYKESTTLNPFYYSNTLESKSENSSTFWTPLLPLYYSYQNKEINRKNLFWLLDYETTKDSLSRFFIHPFYYYKKEEYNLILPIFFSYRTEENTDKTVIPLIYSSSTRADKSSSKNILLVYNHEFDSKDTLESLRILNILYKKDSYTMFIPFYFHWMNQSSKENPEESSLLIPIYYTNKIQNGNTYTNLLGIFSYESNKDSERIGTMVTPFYFYKKDVYRIFFPIIFKFGSESEKAPTGRTYSPFYYNSWNEKEETTLLFNYYSESNQFNNYTFKTFFPFYFRSNSDTDQYTQYLNYYSSNNKKTEESFQTIFPVYFHSEDTHSKTDQGLLFYQKKNKKTNDYFRTVFPIYYSWKNPNSDGYLLFPLLINIDYPNKTNFNLNLLGLAQNTNKGILNPDIQIDAGTKDSYTYLDTDLTWLYNIVKIETRISTKIVEDLKNSITKSTPKEDLASTEKPKFQKKKDFTRENTYNFYGVNILFSAFSYEAGDSKRHFRLLPLTWITWDKKSKDQLIALPFFLYFKDLESVYAVAFPFYANQEIPGEKRSSYGLFLYLKEEYKENNLKEKSFIWPFMNTYSSDTREGSRFLPIYRYKKVWNQKEENANTISIAYLSNFYKHENGIEKGYIYSYLWFYNLDKTADTTNSNHFSFPFYLKTYQENLNSQSHKFISLPFYFSSEYDKKLEYRNSIFWTVPILVFRNRENVEINWNILLLNNYFDSPKKNNLFLSMVYYHNQEFDQNKHFLTTRWFVPLFYYDRKLPLENEKYDKFKIYTPVFLYSSAEDTTTYEKRFDYYITPLLFYYLNNPSRRYYNFAILFSYESYKQDENTTLNLTPLISIKNNSKFNNHFIFPIYSYSTSKTEDTFLSPIYSYSNAKTNNEITHKIPLFAPVLWYKNSNKYQSDWNFLSIFYSRSSPEVSSFGFFPLYHSESKQFTKQIDKQNYFLPIYYYKNIENENKKETDFITIFSRSYFKDTNTESITYKFPSFIPFVFYLNQENENSSWNFLSLLYKRKEENTNSFGFFPILKFSNTIQKESTNYNSYILPLYYRNYNEDKYYQSSNFYCLFYSYEKDNNKEVNYESTSHKVPLLIPFVYYQNSVGEKEKNINLLSIFYYRENENSNSFGLFPLFGKRRTLISSMNYLLPLYYFDSEKTEYISSTDFITIPFLFKTSKVENTETMKYQLPAYLPFVYNYSSENENRGFNILTLFYSRKSKNYSSLGLIPLFHFSDSNTDKSELNETYSYFFPYFQFEDKETKIRNLLGLLYHQNYTKRTDTNSLSILYPLLNIKTTPKEFHYENLLGLIEYNADPETSDFNLIWLGYKNHKKEKSLNLFPFYYSSESESEKKKVILPLLTYTNNTKEEDFQSTGLSIIYHSKKDLITKEEDTLWLLGILYYHITRPSERGYEGQGSLWGLLWEYKTESETNYKKLSILKVIPIFKEGK